MILRKTFIVEMHEEFGSIGLRPVDMPHADPLGGMAIAHDILEHFAKDDGGIECELMALGAALYVRGEHYHAMKGSYYTDPAEHISSDFPELYRHYEYEHFTMRNPGKTAAIRDDENTDETLRRCVVKATALIHDELQGCEATYDWNNEHVLGWLRKGYRRARQRYKKVRRAELTECGFMAIEDACDKYLKHAEPYGQKITVTLDTRYWDVKLTELPHPDDEDCY